VLWFFLQLAPTNSIVPRLDVANDRQLYLASWGLFLALSIQLRYLPNFAFAGLVMLFAATSILRQLDYRSEIALWESSVALSPWNARGHNNLGYAYQQAGRVQDARREYQAALVLDPGYAKARLNLRSLGD
jgi:tetratricopeptide (TPR) repeat protein